MVYGVYVSNSLTTGAGGAWFETVRSAGVKTSIPGGTTSARLNMIKEREVKK